MTETYNDGTPPNAEHLRTLGSISITFNQFEDNLFYLFEHLRIPMIATTRFQRIATTYSD